MLSMTLPVTLAMVPCWAAAARGAPATPTRPMTARQITIEERMQRCSKRLPDQGLSLH